MKSICFITIYCTLFTHFLIQIYALCKRDGVPPERMETRCAHLPPLGRRFFDRWRKTNIVRTA